MSTPRLRRRTVAAIVVAVVALVVVALVLTVSLLGGRAGPDIASGRATVTTPSMASGAPTPGGSTPSGSTPGAPTSTAGSTAGSAPSAAPLVVYLGNSFVGGSTEDSGAADRFPAMVANALSTDWQTITADGSGYLAPSAGGLTFADLADQVPSNAALVVILGSDNDEGYSREKIMDAALDTLQIIRLHAPAARVLVVSTPWVSADPPDGILASRDAVRDAAAMDNLPYVDPIADGWWVTGPAGQIGGDGLHPTDLGHDLMAEHLEPVIQGLLPGR
ncbi:SGNH/GDSL hydrolase family protein [Subtercola sp. YIM 133946]|uniref:SGNH/GDSL hydrolase family protein n=1 Tax=Subtercola sp. YIM 133946 TaxID=3118909 RepID=UPI002F93F766